MYSLERKVERVFDAPCPLKRIQEFNELFNEQAHVRIFDFSNMKKGFLESRKELSGYYLETLSNYENAYVLDNKSNNIERKLNIRKVVNLDLNVLTAFNHYVNGKNSKDGEEVYELLKYLKNENFEFNMSTAIMERSMSPIENSGEDVWKEIINNFLRFIKKDTIIEEISRVHLSESDKKDAERIFNEILKPHYWNEYIILNCLVLKAFLIKQDKKIKNKTEELVKYSLSTLNIFLEYELTLLDKYFERDLSKYQTFKKIEGFSKDVIKKINNTTWDIFHIRLLELQMFKDNQSEEVVYHYFATRDKAFIELANFNPMEMFVILPEMQYAIRKLKINSILDNKKIFGQILDDVQREKRKANLQKIDYKSIQKSLAKEINENQKMKK